MSDFKDEFDELVPEFSNEQESENTTQATEESTSVGSEEITEEEKSSLEEGKASEEEVVSTDEVIKDAEDTPITDSPTEGESIETPVIEDPISETPTIDPVIQELREQNKQLMEMVQKMTSQPVAASEETPTEETPKMPESLDQLLSEVNLDEAFSDRDKFIELMNHVASFAREQAVQRVATTLPQYVVAQVRQTEYLQKETQNFYDKHKGLVPFKKAVGIVTNEVVEEHPDWNLPKVLDEVATRSYTLLNLQQEAENSSGNPSPVTSNNSGKPKPALNTSTSGRRNAPKQLTKLQQEIADIL